MSDSPIAHVGAIWRLKSPMDTMSYASAYLTSDDLASLKEICALLIGDDDPDAWKKSLFRMNGKCGNSGNSFLLMSKGGHINL